MWESSFEGERQSGFGHNKQHLAVIEPLAQAVSIFAEGAYPWGNQDSRYCGAGCLMVDLCHALGLCRGEFRLNLTEC